MYRLLCARQKVSISASTLSVLTFLRTQRIYNNANFNTNTIFQELQKLIETCVKRRSA